MTKQTEEQPMEQLEELRKEWIDSAIETVKNPNEENFAKTSKIADQLCLHEGLKSGPKMQAVLIMNAIAAVVNGEKEYFAESMLTAGLHRGFLRIKNENVTDPIELLELLAQRLEELSPTCECPNCQQRRAEEKEAKEALH